MVEIFDAKRSLWLIVADGFDRFSEYDHADGACGFHRTQRIHAVIGLISVRRLRR
jgi:hypothetical protein